MTSNYLIGTYWNSEGAFNTEADELQKEIPDFGECPSNRPALEAFRKAGKLYYDLYNNGGFNYMREINNFFKVSVKKVMNDDAEAIRIVEKKMDQVIVAAWRERHWFNKV